MKLGLLALVMACEAALVPEQLAVPQNYVVHATAAAAADPLETPSARLVKRDARRKAIVNKQWLKDQEEPEEKHPDLPGPWLRTIYDDIKEVVTPTVIGGVTFSTKPTDSPAGTEMWVTVNNDGSPKVIRPHLKNGIVQHGFPDVKTYFETATTIVHKQEEIQAHNLEEGDVYEEVVMLPEDDTYVKLSPLMRCTPDFYFNVGPAQLVKSAPFCKPHNGEHLRVGRTYFLIWYSQFYKDAKTVRFHYSYVKEKMTEKGLAKRGLDDPRNPVKDPDAEVPELDLDIKQSENDRAGAFYTSDWIKNDQGWFPIDVKEEWVGKVPYRAVAISIQPDTVADDVFELSKAPQILLTFQLQESVGKNTKAMHKLQDSPPPPEDIYYIVMGIPTMVVVAVFAMYLFVRYNKRSTDLSHLRAPKRSRFGNQYGQQYEAMDVSKPTGYKQQ